MRTAVRHERPRRFPMTVEEASRINAQYEADRLDLDLPGTWDTVTAARRVLFRAELWGADRTDHKRRQLRWLLWAATGFIAITIAGLIACLAFTQ